MLEVQVVGAVVREVRLCKEDLRNEGRRKPPLPPRVAELAKCPALWVNAWRSCQAAEPCAWDRKCTSVFGLSLDARYASMCLLCYPKRGAFVEFEVFRAIVRKVPESCKFRRRLRCRRRRRCAWQRQRARRRRPHCLQGQDDMFTSKKNAEYTRLVCMKKLNRN